MTIVANYTDVFSWEEGFDISLCHVAVMGTEYIRSGSLPTKLIMYTDDTPITWTLAAITSKYTIGNTLDIQLRQRAGTVKYFVAITQGDPHTIVIAPQPTDSFIGYLYFESTDANSNADTPVVLKKDYVHLTLLPPECKPPLDPITLAYDFNTVDEIEWIVEYLPKIYFPKYIWTGYHTLDGINC